MILLVLLLSALFSISAFAAPKLAKKKVALRTGNAYVLKLKGNAAGKKVTWSTSNKRVVALVGKSAQQVVLKTKKAGKATVTAKIGKKKLTCRVIVKKNKGMPKKLTLLVGDTFTFSVAKKAKWTLSDSSLARVTKKKGGKKAVLKAVSSGKVILRAAYGKKKAACTITILTKDGRESTSSDTAPADTSATEAKGPLSISTSALRFTRAGMSQTLTINRGITPVSGVVWKSSNPNVATVSNNGRVHSVADGTATITGTVEGQAFTCTVTVAIEKSEDEIEAALPVISRSVTFVKTNMVTTLKSAGTVSATLDWKSNNTKVATVEQKGENKIIRSQGAGKTTVEAVYNGKKYVYNVNVHLATLSNGKSDTKPVTSQSKTIYKKDNTLYIVTPRLYWFDTKEEIKGLTWTSKDESIVTVKQENGVWKARPVKNGSKYNNGKTAVTCKYGGGTFTINITVNIPDATQATPTISASSATLTKAGSTCKVYLKNTDATVTWKSSKTSVATVTSKDGVGTVKAVANGTANITTTLSGKTYTMKVTVNIPQGEGSIALQTKQVKSGNNVLFTYKAPAGWTAKLLNSKYEDFAFVISDTTGNYYVQVYTNDAAYKTAKAGKYYKKVYGYVPLYVIPASGFKSNGFDTAGLFKGWVQYTAGRTGATMSSSIYKKVNSSVLTGDILHVAVSSKKSGKTTTSEQIFFGNVFDVGSIIYTPQNMPDLKKIDPDMEYNVDYMPLLVTNMVTLSAPKAQFDNYADTLVAIYNSITFSDYFWKKRAEATDEVYKTIKSNGEKAAAAAEKQLAAFLDYLHN